VRGALVGSLRQWHVVLVRLGVVGLEVLLLLLLQGRHRAGGLVGEQLLGVAIVQGCKRKHFTIWVLLQMAIAETYKRNAHAAST